MYFYEILEQILSEKSISVPDAARLCGLSDGTVRSMIVRKNKSVTIEVAFRLANGLNVSLERLNGMPELADAKKTPPSIDEDVDQNKMELDTIYSDINEAGQSELLKYARYVYSQLEYKKCDQFEVGKETA